MLPWIRSDRGFTLVEMILTVAIIAMVAFMAPLVLRVLNSLKYLQQSAAMKAEARDILWQMTHDFENAAQIFIGTNPWEISVWVPDFAQFSDQGRFENPALNIKNSLTTTQMPTLILPPGYSSCKNLIQHRYWIIDERDFLTGWDKNKNGKRDTQPYLLKETTDYLINNQCKVDGLGAFYDPVRKYQTLLYGKIGNYKSTAQPVFSNWSSGSSDTYTITLPLRASFMRKGDPDRVFTAVVAKRTAG